MNKAEELVESIVSQYEERLNDCQIFKSNKKLFFDRIKNEVLDFQELIYRVELMGRSSLRMIAKRFDQSMDQFELVSQDPEN